MNHRYLKSLIVSFCFSFLWAESLSLEEALQMATTSNVDYQIQQNRKQQAKNTELLGLTKLLPTLDAGARATYEEREVIEVVNPLFTPLNSNSLSGNLTMNWILFDGFQTWATKSFVEGQLKVETLKTEDLKRQLEINVKVSYYQLAIIQQLEKWWEAQYESSQSEFLQSKTKWELGSLPRRDWLKAQIKVKNDSIAWVNQKIQMQQGWNQLSQIIGIDALTSQSNIPELDTNIQLKEEVSSEINLENNLQIQTLRSQVNLANDNARSVASTYYPRLVAYGTYSYLFSENEFDFGNRVNEFNTREVGLNLTWNLFNGLQSQMDYRNAKLDVMNAKLQLQNSKNEMESEYQLKLKEYSLSQQQLETALTQYELTQEHLQMTEESYKLGAITQFEYDQARLDYQSSWVDLQQKRLKVYELQLMVDYLSGF